MASLPTRLAQLAAGLPLLACAAAFAQSGAPADPLEHIAPHERMAYLQQLIARQQAARVHAEAAADTTGPVLTAFSAGTTLNISKAEAPFKIKVKATDDKSGVAGTYFYATGPSGQSINAYAYAGYPAKSVSVTGGFNSPNRMLEPGAWKFKYGYGYDLAGNYSLFDEATLDALGNTTFTVVNSSGYDLVKPLLVSGEVLTPTVSLAAIVPGTTDMHRYVGAKVTASDAGNTALAGVRSVDLNFCKVANPGKCIYLYGNVYANGQASVTLTTGHQLSADSVTGTFELAYATIYDHANNYTQLTGSKFGGITDFGLIFPTTSIKIEP
ncbi:MAG: hypothetical protein IPG91_15065 [Ideonella sp.]|nr:hypothetical protein [Ideonella sp.]